MLTFRETHDVPMLAKLAAELMNAMATALLDDDSGIELLTHANNTVNEFVC